MFLDINGRLINTVSFGSGSQTFLAHGGWIGNWELWQQPFEILSQRYRTVAYDHRGSGETKVPAEDITPAGLVEDLFGVMDALSIEKAVLASESSGSLTVVQAALQQPARFEALIIVSGMVKREKTPMTEQFYQALRHNYLAVVQTFVNNCTPEKEVDHIRRWGKNMLQRADPEQAVRLTEIQHEVDLTPLLKDIRIPTLIIHGDKDTICPVEGAKLMASQIPASKLVIMEDTGHVPMLTRPVELTQIIQDFLQKL